MSKAEPERPVPPPPPSSLTRALYEHSPDEDDIELDATGGVSPTGASARGATASPAADAWAHVPDAPAAETPAQEDHGVLFIGPPGAGKTILAGAIDQACKAPGRDDGASLSFIPEPSAALLVQHVVRYLHGRDKAPGATNDVAEYEFEITGRQRAFGIHDRSLRVRLVDGPGGGLFPMDAHDDIVRAQIQTWRAKLIPAGQKATYIVFCVDTCQPRREVIDEGLPALFAEMRSEGLSGDPFAEFDSYIDRARLWLGGTRCGPMKRLKAARVLLLLTKVDVLCAQAVQGGMSGRIDPNLTPMDLAERIDPIALAFRTVGARTLRALRENMLPQASLAVAATSAWGFHAGYRQPLIGANGRPTVMPGESSEHILEYWAPFGIREALLFLLFGTESGPVARIRPIDLSGAPGSQRQPFRSGWTK